jgi:branched-chain amino acid transport system permease protein
MRPTFCCRCCGRASSAGTLYSLIALGFVLIFKASGVFNFAQGIMVVFAALTLGGALQSRDAGLDCADRPRSSVSWRLLAIGVERVVLRKLVNQPDIILFMATIGLTYFLIGLGESIFGGEPKKMIAEELGLPTGSTTFEPFGGILIIEHLDVAAVVMAVALVTGLAVFFNKTRRSAAHCARWPTTTRLRCLWAFR